MGRKYFVIILGLCLAVTWGIKGFAQQYQKSNKPQPSPVFEATLYFEENVKESILLEDGIAKLKNGKLHIEYNSPNNNDASEITKITEFIFKFDQSDELLFNQITVTMPFLGGYARERLINEFTAAMNNDELIKPNGGFTLTDRDGEVTSTWNILAWHIESFDFPTLDSKDDSQLIQYVTIRVEKIERDDDDDNE